MYASSTISRSRTARNHSPSCSTAPTACRTTTTNCSRPALRSTEWPTACGWGRGTSTSSTRVPGEPESRALDHPVRGCRTRRPGERVGRSAPRRHPPRRASDLRLTGLRSGGVRRPPLVPGGPGGQHLALGVGLDPGGQLRLRSRVCDLNHAAYPVPSRGGRNVSPAAMAFFSWSRDPPSAASAHPPGHVGPCRGLCWCRRHRHPWSSRGDRRHPHAHQHLHRRHLEPRPAPV